jgi:tartrate-resistant acid phosphatase type 5
VHDDGSGGVGGSRRLLSRRSFLVQTAAFSALSALRAETLFIPPARPLDPGARHLLALGDWGTVKEARQQIAVAQSMRRWIETHSVKPEALFMLGDNFYGEMPGGVNSPRWGKQFEEMYPATHFPGPAYAVLGNHDYEKFRGNKVTAQLDYAKSRTTRWTMPSRWYSFTFPEDKPLATFICLDSNLPGTKNFDFLPWSFLMSAQQMQEQDIWLRSELAKPRATPFLIVVAHHPLYTNGAHRDSPLLIGQWDELLRAHKVDLYLSGHDHDLQHLEFAGHPTSFVVSGGGGAELVDWTTPPASRGPWGGRVLGFTNLEVTPQTLTFRHIGQDGSELYAFSKHAG